MRIVKYEQDILKVDLSVRMGVFYERSRLDGGVKEAKKREKSGRFWMNSVKSMVIRLK
ncbi:MAG: hypothetical protein JW837_10900 [Sedimentisphaerales bacterium]|nr:hypothetical protein [Sedimentisphaerales bacterium]